MIITMHIFVGEHEQFAHERGKDESHTHIQLSRVFERKLNTLNG